MDAMTDAVTGGMTDGYHVAPNERDEHARKCDRCYTGYIVRWEVPGDYEWTGDSLRICNRCGHAVMRDAERANAEEQSVSMEDLEELFLCG